MWNCIVPWTFWWQQACGFLGPRRIPGPSSVEGRSHHGVGSEIALNRPRDERLSRMTSKCVNVMQALWLSNRCLVCERLTPHADFGQLAWILSTSNPSVMCKIRKKLPWKLPFFGFCMILHRTISRWLGKTECEHKGSKFTNLGLTLCVIHFPGKHMMYCKYCKNVYLRYEIKGFIVDYIQSASIAFTNTSNLANFVRSKMHESSGSTYLNTCIIPGASHVFVLFHIQN